ncbi:hypothetical protein ACOSP7_027626 [Xanthoceras sorbifolium]
MEKFWLCCLILMAFIGCFGVMTPVESRPHVVGKNFGWKVPDNDSFYRDWTDSRFFTVGDELVFMYTSGTHNVMEVSKKDFETCTKDNIIRKNFKGPTTFVELNRAGIHYYICDFQQHCLNGMKLTVTVMEKESLHSTSSISSSPSSNGEVESYPNRWIGRLGTVGVGLVIAVTHALVG